MGSETNKSSLNIIGNFIGLPANFLLHLLLFGFNSLLRVFCNGRKQVSKSCLLPRALMRAGHCLIPRCFEFCEIFASTHCPIWPALEQGGSTWSHSFEKACHVYYCSFTFWLVEVASGSVRENQKLYKGHCKAGKGIQGQNVRCQRLSCRCLSK